MATRLPPVDVVLIGVGWVNGIIAKEITARTSLRVVGLERGPYNSQDPDFSYNHDELRFEVRKELMQDLSREPITWRNDSGQTARPMRTYGSFNPGNEVGGAGIHWGAQTWRPHQDDLTYATTLRQVLGKDPVAASLDPGLRVYDWPITYDELEAYLTKAEQDIGVSGKAGVLKDTDGTVRKVSGGNTFEAWRSQEYPVPPLLLSVQAEMFKKLAGDMGLEPFPQPTAILSKPFKGTALETRPPCTYCGFCTRYGCHVGAKGSALVSHIPAAEATGRLEIRPLSYVTKVNTDTSGKATSVSYVDVLTETEYEQPADIFVLGAFELNNVRLLLLSGIGQPYDPQTETGVVGRAYTYQGSTAGSSASFPKMRFWNNVMGNSGMGIVSDAFGTYLSPFRIKEMDRIGAIGAFGTSVGGGGNGPIVTVGNVRPPPNVQGARNWGADWKKWVMDTFPGRTVSMGGSAQSPAYRQNYLDLDPTYRDAYGQPVLRMTFNWTENENKMFHGSYEVRKPVMEALMADYGGERMSGFAPQRPYTIAPYQSTHNTGGAIMGDDPKTSAVNRYQQVWGTPNLWVVGASAFPQNFWMNPTGTVWALAYMAADSIIDRYLKAPGPLVPA